MKPTKYKGGVSVGLVVFSFALLIYIILPLTKTVFSSAYLSIVKENAINITETAIFSVFTQIDADRISQKEIFIHDVVIKLKAELDELSPRNIYASLDGSSLHISFDFSYAPAFSDLRKEMTIDTIFQLPFLNKPAQKIE